jgi:galactokinase
VDSEYNNRRRECESGVAILRQYYPSVKSLRDVTTDMLTKHKAELAGKVYDRCLYVVQEIGRVQEASADLDKGDLLAFGKKMFDTHDGLSRLYEVSCPELDFLVQEAGAHAEVAGARMMGGGFGGCTINLVRNKFIDEFVNDLQVKYKNRFGIDMASYRVRIVNGTGRVDDAELARWT